MVPEGWGSQKPFLFILHTSAPAHLLTEVFLDLSLLCATSSSTAQVAH